MALKKLVTNSFETDSVTADIVSNDINNNISTANTNANTALLFSVPQGGIIMWSGSIATIPTGWALCDGADGRPDLRGRFVVGAASDSGTGQTFTPSGGAVSGEFAPGQTGGEVAHKLTVDEMPAHTHEESYNTPSSGQDQAGSGSGDNDDTSTKQTGSTGGGFYHENRPPYFALAYIIKT